MKHILNGVVFALALLGFQAAFGVELTLSSVLIVIAASLFGDIAEGVYTKINETDKE